MFQVKIMIYNCSYLILFDELTFLTTYFAIFIILIELI